MRTYCFPAVLLLACSDYNLSGSTDKNDARGEDSGFEPDTDEGSDDEYEEDTDPKRCEKRTIEGYEVAMRDECFQEAAPVGSFTPVLEWKKDSWAVAGGSTQIMMMPAVGSFNDDDGDGDGDQDDIPDVVVITYGNASVIRVVSGDGSGTEILNIQDNSVQGQGGVAIGDIDGDGWQDIVAPTTNSQLVAYDRRGNKMWTSDSLSGSMYNTCDNPAIADMDGDGSVEIVVGSAIVSSTGRKLGAGRSGIGGVAPNNVGTTSFPYDIDNDGVQEVVVGNALYRKDGSAIWSNGKSDGYPAVGNFDSDAKAEIVVSYGGTIRLQDDDGTVLCSAAIPGAGNAYYGGPPTVADFDGDGQAEFAAAAGSRYSVFEKNCGVKWQATTQDASSGNTGSSVFDFEGDGAAEAVYADETKLWAFAGADGAVKLQSAQHSNATWLEYPAIADVDGDGHAEIIVANTTYTQSHSGFYVFGDQNNSWRSARRIWNQHAYMITNINDDGSIPQNADRNMDIHNNFRSGDITEGSGGYALPDLNPTVEDICTDECDDDKLVVWVSIGNRGYEDIRTDVPVRLMGVLKDGSETLLGESTLSEMLPAGWTNEAFEFRIDGIPDKLESIYATVDGGNDSAGSLLEECDETNNEDEWRESLCP